jgi:serine/threonine protein kinase
MVSTKRTRHIRDQKKQHVIGRKTRRKNAQNQDILKNDVNQGKLGEGVREGVSTGEGANTGGKAINSGGYGCIFKPALKCAGKTRLRGKVSKLMTTRHSEEEYNFIMKYKKHLEHIPNYADYFLLEGITICAPDKLTPKDLLYYTQKCSALQKEELTSKNINDNLDNVLAINMPDGGVDVGDFLAKHHSEESLIQLNLSLIDLLHNGIVPMNTLNIYHCDIKETNILVQSKKNWKKEENSREHHDIIQSKLYTRLIDWGISVEWTKGHEIPDKLLNKPLQYNMPFSIILFNKHFLSMYNEMLKNSPSPNYKEIKKVVAQFIMEWFKERGMGHFQAINQTLQLLMLNEDNNYSLEEDLEGLHNLDNNYNERKQKEQHDYMFTHYYIADYLITILSKYTMRGELKLLKYFEDVFIKNADLWGFIMSYAAILELYYHNYEKLNEKEIAVFNKLKQIIVSFLFETAITPINVGQLTIELQLLTELFRECKSVPSEYRDYRLLKRGTNVRSIFDKVTERLDQ